MKKILFLVIVVLFLLPVKTYSMTPPSLTIENNKDVITHNNAVLNVALTNHNTKMIAKFEFKFYKYNELGERVLLDTYYKDINTNEKNIHIYFDLNKDFSIVLLPETKYGYYVSAIDEDGVVSSGFSNGFWFTTSKETEQTSQIIESETITEKETNTIIDISYKKVNKASVKKVYSKNIKSNKLKISIKKMKNVSGYQVALYKTKSNARNNKKILKLFK